MQGEGDADAEEAALIRRWLKSAEEMLKRTGGKNSGKKGGEPEERGRPPGDVHPPQPSKP